MNYLYQMYLISSLKNIGIMPTHITFKLITNGLSLMCRWYYFQSHSFIYSWHVDKWGMWKWKTTGYAWVYWYL